MAIFTPKELSFTVSSIVLCYCPNGVSSSRCAGLTCVARVWETFPLEPGEGLMKLVASFQVSLFPKELVISGALCVPGKTKQICFRWKQGLV